MEQLKKQLAEVKELAIIYDLNLKILSPFREENLYKIKQKLKTHLNSLGDIGCGKKWLVKTTPNGWLMDKNDKDYSDSCKTFIKCGNNLWKKLCPNCQIKQEIKQICESVLNG